jgi:hypothetical protein
MSSQKTITIYNGTTSKVISSNSITWGELKSELSSHGITTSNMRAFIGQNQTELSVNSALLPDSIEFDLFLTPKKNKSGAGRTRSECYQIAKEARAENDEAMEYFTSYSSMTTEELNDAVDSWFEYLEEQEEEEQESTEVINIAQIIEDLESSKSKIDEAISVLEGLEGHSRNLKARYNNLVSQLGAE